MLADFLRHDQLDALGDPSIFFQAKFCEQDVDVAEAGGVLWWWWRWRWRRRRRDLAVVGAELQLNLLLFDEVSLDGWRLSCILG